MIPVIAVTTSMALVAAGMSSSATSPSVTLAAGADVQADFVQTLEQLKVSVVSMAADPTLAVILADAGVGDLEASIEQAIELTEELTSSGWDSLEQILEAHEFVEELPSAIDEAVEVATDGAEMYSSEIERIVARDHRGTFDAAAAGEVRAAYLDGVDTADMLECDADDRARMFNLGYYTWVEQQGVPIEEFEARRSQEFWAETRQMVHVWDDMIEAFNAQVAG
jgi:cysteine synthase A